MEEQCQEGPGRGVGSTSFNVGTKINLIPSIKHIAVVDGHLARPLGRVYTYACIVTRLSTCSKQQERLHSEQRGLERMGRRTGKRQSKKGRSDPSTVGQMRTCGPRGVKMLVHGSKWRVHSVLYDLCKVYQWYNTLNSLT